MSDMMSSSSTSSSKNPEAFSAMKTLLSLEKTPSKTAPNEKTMTEKSKFMTT
jgi:hypothetical protein